MTDGASGVVFEDSSSDGDGDGDGINRSVIPHVRIIATSMSEPRYVGAESRHVFG